MMPRNREREKALYRERKAKGLCVKCGQPAMPGKRYCEKHHKIHIDGHKKFFSVGKDFIPAEVPKKRRGELRERFFSDLYPF